MSKLYRRFFIYIYIFISCISSVSAHPLDISSTVLSIGDTGISGVTYFHSYEVGVFLGKKGYNVTEVGEYYQYYPDVKEYFLAHFGITRGGKPCNILNLTIPEKEGYEILSRGLELQYSIDCSENSQDFNFYINFFNEFTLQTNRLTIVNTQGDELFFKVGTPQIQHIAYQHGVKVERIDTDNDGVDDQEEIVYKTHPENRDSDGDYYLDGEEVNNGWNPLNKNPSPGQSIREQYPETFLIQPQRHIVSNAKQDYSLVGNTTIGTVFQDLLYKIGKSASGESNIGLFTLFCITVGLGFLHALGPGHAKGLLSSIMIHKQASFLSGFRFILIFSIVHIIDIFLLFLILRFFLHIFDANMLLNGIQKISSIVLLLLGIYMLYRAWYGTFEDESNNINTSKITVLAIIAGLAPCSFGWSLFFMLISLGKIAWVPWLIFAICLGIFICLFLILVLLTYSKRYSYSRFSRISEYSVFLSAFCIFIIGLYLTNMNFNLL